MDVINSELHSTKSKLDHEILWRDHTSGVHHQLLKDKSQLILRYIDLFLLHKLGKLANN